MQCLKCYSLDQDIKSGITVSHFETITTVDPEKNSITTATIQTLPLLADPIYRIKRTFAAASQFSLTFVHEAPKKAEVSQAGVILSVKANEWVPKSDTAQISILDPCGLKGHVLLFIRSGCKNALLSSHDPTVSISVTEDGEPKIAKVNRANLLLDVLFEGNSSTLQEFREGANKYQATILTGTNP